MAAGVAKGNGAVVLFKDKRCYKDRQITLLGKAVSQKEYRIRGQPYRYKGGSPAFNLTSAAMLCNAAPYSSIEQPHHPQR